MSEFVKVLTGPLPTPEDDTHYFGGDVDAYLALGQRAAILLVQARALEARHLAGELAVNGAAHPIAVSIMKQCWERSHKLEAIGMMLAQDGGWPIPEGREQMVCRCAIDHGEISTVTGDDTQFEKATFVCAHCKLPKHGAAVPSVAVVQ